MGWFRDRFDDWAMGREAAEEMRGWGEYDDGEYEFLDDDLGDDDDWDD